MAEHNILILPPPPPAKEEPLAFSNAMRLSPRQWLGVGLFAVLLIAAASPLWKRVEPFPLEADYRIPHDLKEDYWLYERFADLAAAEHDTIVLGDSVVWGVYVTRQQTLSHYLNDLAHKERCVNLGLVGAHPLALGGLIEHYAQSVTGKTVLLQCNPLWMTSPVFDLQDERKPDEIFHPRLLPQFSPRIPRYNDQISPRLGIVVEQHLAFSGWTIHLQQAYYNQNDIPGWTLDHPCENPFEPLTRGLPPSDNVLRQEAKPWFARGVAKQDFPWLDMDTSLQWAAFQRSVEMLQRRGNRVFVLVGPFNEHMLTPKSLERYQKVKGTITAWLQAKDIPHLAPAALPSEQYGDASHPLAAGYEALARQLLNEPFFQAKK
jgi:hypothetical protein